MLTISLDEGAIFDIYSIYQVKVNFGPTAEKRAASYNGLFKLHNEIAKQIGVKKLLDILDSPEYEALYEANVNTFEMVDIARKSWFLAKKVDNSNIKRYNCKVALQKKFFGTQPVEIKT